MGSKKLNVSSLCIVLLTIILSGHFNIDSKIQLTAYRHNRVPDMIAV